MLAYKAYGIGWAIMNPECNLRQASRSKLMQ
jgi:hypothetical protein